MTATIPEIEITELEKIEATRVDGVASPANGIPILLMKSVQAEPDEMLMNDATLDVEKANPGCGCCPDCTMDDTSKAVVGGKVDQKPDISLGEKILGLLGQAMGNESQEVAAGHHGEAGDVHMLAQAHDIVHAWCNGEKTHPDGLKSAAPVDEDAEKAKLSSAERNALPDSAFALPGRHYPIHDENHAHAALSEVAQHGTPEEKAKVRAAVRRRYPDIKVDGDSSKSVADVAEGEATVDDVTQGTDDQIAKAVEAAVTKALQPYEERIKSLGAELAKVKATPIPGGPVLSANARPQGERTAELSEWSAKAAHMEKLADQVNDPEMRAGYANLARQYAEKATQPSTQ